MTAGGEHEKYLIFHWYKNVHCNFMTTAIQFQNGQNHAQLTSRQSQDFNFFFQSFSVIQKLG